MHITTYTALCQGQRLGNECKKKKLLLRFIFLKQIKEMTQKWLKVNTGVKVSELKARLWLMPVEPESTGHI